MIRNSHLKYKKMPLATAVLLLMGITLACERDTRLMFSGGNPPAFLLSGSGSLGAIRVRGPKKQREKAGEEASMYWMIEPEREKDIQAVVRLSPITYGKVPKGYVQVYPESGEAPPLIEGERYNIRVVTFDAKIADTYFIIRDGKAIEDQ